LNDFPWLIEHNIQFMNQPMWLRAIIESPHDSPRVTLEFSKDANLAMRFSRKQDADAFIYLHHGNCINCRATEHGFIPACAPVPPPWER
jgi:hypothetical protein